MEVRAGLSGREYHGGARQACMRTEDTPPHPPARARGALTRPQHRAAARDVDLSKGVVVAQRRPAGRGGGTGQRHAQALGPNALRED